jgi:hypothetical protein
MADERLSDRPLAALEIKIVQPLSNRLAEQQISAAVKRRIRVSCPMPEVTFI